MKVAYVAGPYRDPRGHFYVSQNIERARGVAVKLWGMGFAVICPHSNCAHFDGAAPDSVWLEGGLELLRRSDLVVLTPDWEKSSGTLAEVELARSLDIPIFEYTESPEGVIALLPCKPNASVV